MYKLTELQKQGKFSVKRDKDVLSTALGSKEYGGHVRGVSSKLTFRDWFQKARSTYKRHDRYKEEMIQGAEKAAESNFKAMFAQLAEQQSGQIWMNPLQIGATAVRPDGDDAPSGISPSEYGMCSEQCCVNDSTTIPGGFYNKYYSIHAALSDQ